MFAEFYQTAGFMCCIKMSSLIPKLSRMSYFLIPILISVTASVLSDTIGNGIVFMFFLLVLVIGVTFIRNISFNPNNQK